MNLRVPVVCVVLLFSAIRAEAQAPISYRLSFPEAEHRWMQVEAIFPDLPAAALDLHMSRSSPGRYALHEFAKNVFDVRIADADGQVLPVTRPNLDQWVVAKHSTTVRVTYRVFGDRVDGTYLGIDSTHAHINMPAAFMWAKGLEQRAATVRFEPPAGVKWQVATQLLPGADAFTFTAPNLQYLMDSPSEFSAFTVRTFSVRGGSRVATFRLAVHHDGTDADVDAFAHDVERVVREAGAVFGEYPMYEGNKYTFITDYLPWVNGDGMEHRNSTIITAPGSIRANRARLLGSVAHEFFHSWNVERIRPRSLEPFQFDEVNVSGELWLAEGVTNYYGPLMLLRAGLTQLEDFMSELGDVINDVNLSPGRRIRSVEEMSRFAPFVDAATAIDRTSFSNTYLSYYTWGEAIGLGLDLELRGRSGGKVTLDHVMRALWNKYGKPGGSAPGYVDRPYTAADVKNALGEVAGDMKFAEEFFARYVEGQQTMDYARLLRRAGIVLRPRAPGQGYAGDLRLQENGGRIRVAASVPFGTPAYAAGLERDDVIVTVAGASMRAARDVENAIRTSRPGETVPLTFERRGQTVSAMLRLIEDPHQELIPAEATGQPPTGDEKRFREAWLSSAARNTF